MPPDDFFVAIEHTHAAPPITALGSARNAQVLEQLLPQLTQVQEIEIDLADAGHQFGRSVVLREPGREVIYIVAAKRLVNVVKERDGATAAASVSTSPAKCEKLSPVSNATRRDSTRCNSRPGRHQGTRSSAQR